MFNYEHGILKRVAERKIFILILFKKTNSYKLLKDNSLIIAFPTYLISALSF